MKLSSPFPALRLLRRRGHGSLFLWLLALAGVEVFGRRLRTDLGDLALLVFVLLAAGVTFAQHRRRPLPWLSALVHRVRRTQERWRGWKVNFGADFRREPPVPMALPPVLWKPLVALALVVAASFLGRGVFPEAAREFLIRGSYTVYLLLLGVLWAASITELFMMMFLVHAQVHDLFVARFRGDGSRPMRSEATTHTAVFLFLLIAGTVFPVQVAYAVLGLASLVILLALLIPRRPRLTLLWKPTHRSVPPRCLDLKAFLALQYGLFLGCLLLLLLWSRGSHAEGGVSAARNMPITSFLGLVCAWVAAAGTVVMAARLLRLVHLERVHDPARPVTRTLHLNGVPREAQPRIRRRLAEFHLAARFGPEPRRKTDVPLQLDPQASPGPWTLRWPLSVREANLTDPEHLFRYRRRWEVQCRRLLIRGLQRLFKRAARHERTQGDGYWLGVQHWFVVGLSRDVDESDPNLEEDGLIEHIIGPPYHKLFPREVRHHFHQVMQALELDLIFVEDGVKFPTLRRVLDTLFEIHDRHGARRRAEERDFHGLAQVAVMIHDFTLEQPFHSTDYPEPSYEDIGRARILHLFKDRGGDAEVDDVPVDLSRIPVLSGF